MKKKGCVITLLVILTIAIAIVVVLGYFWVQAVNSESVKEYKKEITAKTEEMTKQYTSQIEDVTAQTIKEAEEEQADIDIEDEGRKAAMKDTLKAKYYEILLEQKSGALGMLDALLSQAKADYEALVASGQSNPTTKGDLVSKYLAKVDIMESQMDQSFAATIAKMGEQLQTQGIDGQDLMKEYESEYKKIKEENRQYFMDKAMSAI